MGIIDSVFCIAEKLLLLTITIPRKYYERRERKQLSELKRLERELSLEPSRLKATRATAQATEAKADEIRARAKVIESKYGGYERGRDIKTSQ